MSAAIKTFRDLLVWQKSMALVTEIYRASRTFPKEELYGLTSQLRRAAVSIPSNLAEGHGHRTRSEYSRFVQIAVGSLNELQTQLEISFNLGYLGNVPYNALNTQCREIDRMLYSLSQKL
ncbi:MAG TPA: four helix bundle protein, partial [Opitutales bacterium]|nr:four helix bundle protein [Opitutales bacterium]